MENEKGTEVLDIECYKRLFCVTFYNYDTLTKRVFEISQRRNDLKELRYFYRNNIEYGITFNGMDYDDIVLNYVCSDKNLIKLSTEDQIEAIYKCSNTIIKKDKDYDSFKNAYGKYRYSIPYKQLDTFRYWSKLLRKNKQISLKGLAAQLGLNVEETPIPFNKEKLTDEEVSQVISYNANDDEVTYEVAQELKEKINLRVFAEERYGFNCLSWDGVKLGYNVVLQKLSNKSGVPLEELKQMRTKREQIVLSDIILPFIKFQENDNKHWIEKIDKDYVNCFKTFGACLDYLKGLTVKSTSEISCRVYYKSTVYDIKSGGVHSVHNEELVIPLPTQIYRDKDVSSFYPRLISAFNFSPEHFKEYGFDELVEEIRLERVAIKKTNPPQAELNKLGLNGGIFGNMNNAFTAMEDLQAFLSITINGQLMLMMLAEQNELDDIHTDMANTDGLTFICDKSKESKLEENCKNWEKLTGMDLEAVDYIKVVRKNINNYMAFYYEFNKDAGKEELKIKKKGGFFKTKPELGDSSNFLVIPKAIEAYFRDNTPVEDFIKNHTNIYDFCGSAKIAKVYDVYYNGNKIQQLNRYYVSKKGAYLYKQKRNKKGKKIQNVNQYDLFSSVKQEIVDIKGEYESVLKGVPINILNQKTDKLASEFPVDRDWYIALCREKIEVFESNQLRIDV